MTQRKNKLFLIVAAFLVFASCRNSTSSSGSKTRFGIPDSVAMDSTQINPPKDSSRTSVSIEKPKKHWSCLALDTIKKYERFDNLSCFNRNENSANFCVYIGRANGKEFGMAPSTDSTYEVYQKNKDNWEKTATIPLDNIQYVTITNLRNDAYKDVIITINVTGSGGNEEDKVLIFDRKKMKFVYDGSWDLPNIKYDRKKNIIESAWYGGCWNCGSQKEIYRVKGDSLIFMKGVSYSFADTITGTLEYYKYEGGKQVTVSSHKGDLGDIQNSFEHALFEGI